MAAHAEAQPLTPAAVQALLRTQALGRVLHILPEVASTNSTAFTLAEAGAPDGTVVVAEEQTAGRGRLGRSWFSPPGRNLYCSVLLRTFPSPERVAAWLSWVPLVSGMAVLRTVTTVSENGGRFIFQSQTPDEVGKINRPSFSLKWPNDVFVGDRKIGGVLCESSGFGTPRAALVVGVGLNVNTSAEDFPEDLRGLATSLAVETGRRFDRVELLAGLLLELEVRYRTILSDIPPAVRSEYRTLCSTLGRRVRVTLSSGEHIEGEAQAITAEGALQLIDGGTGHQVIIRAGDVVHLR